MFSSDFDDSPLRTQVVTNGISIGLLGIGYWMNSSSDSQKKTDIIAQLPAQQPPKESEL